MQILGYQLLLILLLHADDGNVSCIHGLILWEVAQVQRELAYATIMVYDSLYSTYGLGLNLVAILFCICKQGHIKVQRDFATIWKFLGEPLNLFLLKLDLL